ncbi:MAG: anion permease, partial [Pararheinheimera sp.]|nr:anion permease [Rheinheimera sp.]
TPPNALLAAYMSKSYGIQLGFADWMILGVPLALTMLLVCWLWLTKFHFRRPTNDSGQNDTPTQLKVLGLMSRS